MEVQKIFLIKSDVCKDIDYVATSELRDYFKAQARRCSVLLELIDIRLECKKK